jgi:hypothetical protein
LPRTSLRLRCRGLRFGTTSNGRRHANSSETGGRSRNRSLARETGVSRCGERRARSAR